MAPLGPASELSAVNEMLASIGEDPVDDMDNLPPSGNTALVFLRGTSRDFQEDGYWFNTYASYMLSPQPDGRILVPTNALSIDGVELDVIERRPYLYNREDATFYFTSDVECEVMVHLDWDELPSSARRYITALATERFIDGFPGANAVTEARNRNLVRAKAAFERESLRNEDLNLTTNGTVANLLRRN
jgi:hypothetical protein